jgi:hypothetical protein
MAKVAKNGRKVKAIALLFNVFCLFFKNEISGEKWTKSNGYSLTFLLFFASLSKNEISGEKWTKSKGYSLTFLLFFVSFSKMK